MNKSKSTLMLLVLISISLLTVTTVNAQDLPPVNNPPEITSFSYTPHLVPILQTVTAEITFNDPDLGDTHTITFDWGDGALDSGVSMIGTHIYQEPGIYRLSATVEDNNGGIITMLHSSKIIVYDTTAGFTSGGGWIICPHDVTGDPARGYFGFVAKYHDDTAKGNVVFHIKDGLRFKSTEIYWLVITGENRVIYGEGLINGETECLFTVKVKDGVPSEGFDIILVNPDTWEIIYDSYESNDATYYDVIPLEGGNIATHKPKKLPKGTQAVAAEIIPNHQSQPANENSASHQTENNSEPKTNNGKALGKTKNREKNTPKNK